MLKQFRRQKLLQFVKQQRKNQMRKIRKALLSGGAGLRPTLKKAKAARPNQKKRRVLQQLVRRRQARLIGALRQAAMSRRGAVRRNISRNIRKADAW